MTWFRNRWGTVSLSRSTPGEQAIPLLQANAWRQIQSLREEEVVSSRRRIGAPVDRLGGGALQLAWSDVFEAWKSPLAKLAPGETQEFTIEPDGAISKHLDIDGLFRMGEDSSRLLVIFHGALNRKKYIPPRYEYRKSLEHRKESLLFLADPTLYLHPTVQLGWYVGSELDDGHRLMAQVVEGVAELARVDKVVLAGSSGGGFAALAVSRRLANSLALAFSPQTSIERYHPGYARRIASVAFPTAGEEVQRLSNFMDRFDLSRLYLKTESINRVMYIQNTGDDFHLLNHCLPFLPRLGLDPGRGVLATPAARMELRYLREGHGAPPPAVFVDYVNRAFDWLDAD